MSRPWPESEDVPAAERKRDNAERAEWLPLLSDVMWDEGDGDEPEGGTRLPAEPGGPRTPPPAQQPVPGQAL